MTPEENNRLMRELLVRNSPKILKKLPTVSGAMGGTTRVKLNNTGLITRLFAEINIPYTVGTADLTAISSKGVMAAIPKVQLLDFDGSSRINTSAYHLSVLNAGRKRRKFHGLSDVLAKNAFAGTLNGNVSSFVSPDSLLTVGAKNLRFVLEIPVAADVMSGDLRGMLAAQFVSGELQLAIDFASLLGNATLNDDFVFDLAATSTITNGTPTVTVFQEYYLPQKIRGVTAIPQMDISTVYEVGVYSRTTDNIVSGQEKLLNFPIVREVNGVMVDFITNGVFAATEAADIAAHKILANGNNILYETDLFLQKDMQRAALGYDLPDGTYWYDFATAPISTAIFGNVQLSLTPGATAVVSPAVEISFESLYAKGSALSGAPV